MLNGHLNVIWIVIIRLCEPETEGFHTYRLFSVIIFTCQSFPTTTPYRYAEGESTCHPRNYVFHTNLDLIYEFFDITLFPLSPTGVFGVVSAVEKCGLIANFGRFLLILHVTFSALTRRMPILYINDPRNITLSQRTRKLWIRH